MKKIISILMLSSLVSAASFADAPQLQNLSPGNVDDVFQSFGALTNFRPLEPASSWADIFGVAVGLVAQGTPAKRIKNVIPNSGDIPSTLPDANAFLAIQAPLGLGVELGLFPTTSVKSLTLRQYSGNVKWTMTKLFFGDILPFDWAFRGGVSNTLIGFKYTYLGVQDTVEFKSNTWNFSTSISKRFWFLEPYVGIGMSYLTGDLSNDGKVTLLNQEFTAKTNLNKKYTSILANVGIQFHIWAFNITTQADWQYGAFNYAAKLGLKF